MATLAEGDKSISAGLEQLNDALKTIMAINAQEEYKKNMALLGQARIDQMAEANVLRDKQIGLLNEKAIRDESGRNARFGLGEEGKMTRLQMQLAALREKQDKALAAGDAAGYFKLAGDLAKLQLQQSPAGTAAAMQTADEIATSAGLKAAKPGSTIEQPLDSKIGKPAVPKLVPGTSIQIPLMGKPAVEMTMEDLVNTLGNSRQAQLAADMAKMILGAPDTDKDKAKAIELFHSKFPQIGKKLGF